MKAFWTSVSVVALLGVGAWQYRNELQGLPLVGTLFADPAAGTAANGRTAAADNGGQRSNGSGNGDGQRSGQTRAQGGGQAGGQSGGQGGGQGGGRRGAPTPVATIAASKAALPMDVTATGWAEADENTTIAAQAQGLVTSIVATDGQMVKKGDLIARLDDRSALATVEKDKANIESDQASLEEASIALKRAETLVKQSVQSQETLDSAKAARDTANATLSAAKATLTADQVALDNTEIRAPFDGRLGDIAVSAGAYLSAGGEVVTIAKYDPISVKFRLSERYLAELHKAEAADVPVDADPEMTGGKPDTGSLRFVDNDVDTATGTILVKARFKNDDAKLWPGQSVNVTVHFPAAKETIVVPTVAVRAGPDGSFIYTVDQDQKVHLNPVEVERSNGDRTSILSGISVGDHIIVEGQVQLASGQTVIEHFGDGQGDASGKPGRSGKGDGSDASGKPSGDADAGTTQDQSKGGSKS